MTQQQALKILKSGVNVFLTGSAGTGKTFLLNQFISYLRKSNKKIGITASTGIAATHLEGRTIHSWSGIGIKKEMDEKSLKHIAKNKRINKRIKETQTLIIDEISMLDANRLTLVDRVCKKIKDPFLPFGGLQIIMCGDFFQLPPVSQGEKSQFAYESPVWQNSNIRVCYLSKQFRQNDSAFTDILNKIRENKAGLEELNLLKTRLNQSINLSVRPTQLYTHNVKVDIINDLELSRIPKKEMTYYMIGQGEKRLVDLLKKNCLAPEELKLKIGAMVMFVKNNFEAGYVNGTLGKVVDYDDDKCPIIETTSGQHIIASPVTWNMEENNEVVASVKQVPLRLAWAITVHKSQGMSLDAAEIDLSKSFEHGMGYVALSRIRRLDNVRLMGINQIALRVSPEVVEKDKEFKKLSEI
ncbi:AAA family ATPase [Patescibacteria group bacterium]|nr:AAA family ATPase [Patescibacteria group bacterium]